jgi:hypothetical protein
MNIKNKRYPIFVPTEDIDEQKTDYYELVDWGYKHLSHPNVLSVYKDDIYMFQKAGGILEIVNEENDSMIGDAEDDVIGSGSVKLNILVRLSNYYETLKAGREKELLYELLRLLDIAIKTKKGIYFRF